MTRPTLVRALAVAGASALLLAACGSSGGGDEEEYRRNLLLQSLQANGLVTLVA